MFKIALINMPFADAPRPSLSMTQLNEVVSEEHPVDVDIHYFNQEFCKFFGYELFHFISSQYTAGLGDWIFRHIAFPDEDDNTEKYLRRHYPQNDPQARQLKETILRKREGVDAKLDELINDYNIADADLVGFSSMFSQNAACFALANKLKKLNPNISIVMGGANCESPMGEEIIRNVPQIDFVFSGPALFSFPELVGNLINDNREGCHKIRGVFSKNNIHFLSPNAVVGNEKPVDDYIPLDYSDFIKSFDTNFPDRKNSKLLLFETSRGCWWGERSHCTFCGLNGKSMGYRSMNADIAIKQFEAMFDYADDCTHFSSVDNIIPQKYTRDVFPYINPPSHINIFYEVKASLKEKEMALLSEKRVKRLQPGIESLSSSTLELMKKGTTAFSNITFLGYCTLYDIFPEWNLLVGFPGEKEDIYKKYLSDLPLLSHLPPPGGCYPVRFDRYSPYFMKADEYGLDLHPYEFYEYVYPFSKQSLMNFAYYFQDRNYAADYINAMISWLGKLNELMAEWNSRWNSESNLCHPELYFTQHNLIYDSRFGESTEYEISETSRQVLDTLTKPKTVSALTKSMSDSPAFDADREIALLQEKRLLFHEEERYLSLVLPRKGSELKELVHDIRENNPAL
jgi:ribosomal peptide maturation radical SAM protein 1